jgi:hypothetical protein
MATDKMERTRAEKEMTLRESLEERERILSSTLEAQVCLV